MSKLLRFAMGVVALLLLAMYGVRNAAAMGMEGFGPAGKHVGLSSDWPNGVEDVLRHPSRVYWNDVNGSVRAYYDGEIETMNDLLELYSQIDLAEHPVVILPGRPKARSFHGTFTPYVVEFDVPGHMEFEFQQKEASAGLVSLSPRMVVHFDGELAGHLEALKIPKNVTLHASGVRAEDALAHANDADPKLRRHAIAALGDAADTSTASLEAVKRAAADENEWVRAAGETAQKKLAAAKNPAELALRKQLAKFIEGQPERARVPSPQELLAVMQEMDADYARGFTARGTRVEPAFSGRGELVGWTVTMGRGRLVVEQRDIEDADHPATEGRFEYTQFVGPERMGSIHGSRVWADGKLIEVNPQATFEPVGSTYDLLIGRILWPLGRGFTRRMDRITSVTLESDRLLRVVAESDGDGLMRRWELLIDPTADYLVRAAKAFRENETEPLIVVETAGIVTGGGRSVAHTARWIEGATGPPASIAVNSVSSGTDEALIQRTEDRLDKLPGLGG
jgi:hypothetical protein